MPWNEADRERYNIVRERYTSDLSDEEYALKEPLLPQPKRRGRKPTPARTNLNAIFYLARCFVPDAMNATFRFRHSRTTLRPP